MTDPVVKTFKAQTELIEMCMEKIFKQEKKLNELADSVEKLYQRTAMTQVIGGRDDN